MRRTHQFHIGREREGESQPCQLELARLSEGNYCYASDHEEEEEREAGDGDKDYSEFDVTEWRREVPLKSSMKRSVDVITCVTRA